MAEQRIDRLRDENATLRNEIAALKAAIRLMLTTQGELKGRALAEHLTWSYSPPMERVCPLCGGKYVGSSCPNSGCAPERLG